MTPNHIQISGHKSYFSLAINGVHSLAEQNQISLQSKRFTDFPIAQKAFTTSLKKIYYSTTATQNEMTLYNRHYFTMNYSNMPMYLLC